MTLSEAETLLLKLRHAYGKDKESLEACLETSMIFFIAGIDTRESAIEFINERIKELRSGSPEPSTDKAITPNTSGTVSD